MIKLSRGNQKPRDVSTRDYYINFFIVYEMITYMKKVDWKDECHEILY